MKISLSGSFCGHSQHACAYQDELLCLMAIHLILMSINKCCTNLELWVAINSGCLGTLSQVARLPPYCIPSDCWHFDILKIILVQCSKLSFHSTLWHIKARQDYHMTWSISAASQLAASQLNCACDTGAKSSPLWGTHQTPLWQQPFPFPLRNPLANWQIYF